MEQSRPPTSKAKLTEVNAYLTCPLCKGYYIDATTIVECLHSFCKSCIIQHLQIDNYCPICELMINTVKPNIKPDKTLQDIVYKLVPGLYASEMLRRRRFWAEHPEEASKVACPEARGLMTERIIFSPQDAISLSIEYTSDEQAAWNRSEPDPDIPLRRYLQCPAMLRVEHLKKFICNKYNVDSQLYHVDILYKRVPLPDHYTLMDIAYIYSWKRNEPMKFFFRITDIALVSERFDYFEPAKQNTSPDHCQQQRATTKQHTITNNNNNIIKKSTSPIRLENKTSNSDKICDNKQTSECSDKQKCADKKDEENTKSEVEKCDDKTKNSEKSSEVIVKEEQTIINDSPKECLETKQNKEVDKIVSENSETIKVKDETVLCDVKVEKEEKLVKETSKDDNCNNKILDDNSKVPTDNKETEKSSEIPEIIPEKSSPCEPKTDPIQIPSSIEEDSEKSHFFKSIQLTAKNSSPPALKPISPEIIRPKFSAQKRKYVRKSEKSPKRPKLMEKIGKIIEPITKIRKIAPKDSKMSEQEMKIRNIKNPIVRLMVSNLNKQATNLTKIVNQTDGTKQNEQNQNEQLQSLIDSCKLNIPSSLSITLTESPRNEDGTIVESKPLAIKPVQNYIEILKLPDKSLPENSTDVPLGKTSPNAPLSQNQKHTFQTMFEETIKRNESMKAQIYQKTADVSKKLYNNSCKAVKKQQNNALDLSTTPPKSEPSSPTNISNTSQNLPKTVHNSISPNSNNNKRNILEIAHQLSKRSRIESESTLKVPETNKTSPKKEVESNTTSPPKQIIINSNFSSGGSISIKRSPKKDSTQKIPIPRLPVSKVPTPKLNPPNIRNGGLLKFSNYTAKLATDSIKTKSPPKSPNNSSLSPNHTKAESPNHTIHGLTPNQILEKYNITNLAQFNANLNQAQLAFQQALMVSHQLELHRLHQNNQKHWMNNPNILAHYENYVQSLKNQQNQICGNGSKN